MTPPGSAGIPEGGPWAPFVAPSWDIGPRALLPDGRPLVMGILNLTPDSFHGGSRAGDTAAAVEHALRLVQEGADILDLGAESSRPGAEPVGADEEQARLLPVVEALVTRTGIPLSVDTVRAETARAALDRGASIVNDISAGGDPGMLPLVASDGCGVVLMHMQGTPRTMQQSPEYRDPVAEIAGFLAGRARVAEEAGVDARRIVVDPGIGFGKSLGHNLALLRELRKVAGARPLLLGASRKRFIAGITGAGVDDRLPGSLAALVAAWHAQATVVRVHDVAESVQFLEVMRAVACGAARQDD